MFKFLKDKIKKAVSKISQGVEKEGKVEETISKKPIEVEKEKSLFSKIKDKISSKIEVGKPLATEASKPMEIKKSKSVKVKQVTKSEEKKPEAIKEITIKKETIKKPIIKEEKIIKEEILDEKIGKKGFFQSITEKIVTKKINEKQFDGLFWELELALMENNVALEVIEKIKSDLKSQLVEMPIRRNKVDEAILGALKDSICGLFEASNLDIVKEIKNKKEKPYIISFLGINGSGKTTSIAKLANLLVSKNISCVLAAADTFRAASIEQLQLHADKLGVKLIKHDYGADPAAVAFDAIKHAKAKQIDVVLIDTAGRMHSNENLLSELKKIVRVANPDLKIFVGESITGNDCVEQAKTFNEAVGIDGIILSKADIDEKGGAAVSVSFVTKKPILYLGMGQDYKDLEPFDSEIIIKGLGFA